MQHVLGNGHVAGAGGGGGGGFDLGWAGQAETGQVQLEVVVLVVLYQEHVDVMAKALNQWHQLVDAPVTELPETILFLSVVSIAEMTNKDSR